METLNNSMRKLELNKKYEFTIKAPELDSFEVEFSVLTEKINYNVKMSKSSNDVFELVLPDELQSLPEEVEYSVNVFYKTNRFLIESGRIQLTKPIQETIKEEVLNPKFEISMVTEAVKESPEVTPTKNILAELTKKNYINDRVKLALKDLKRV
jgi:hypothetical protein